MNRKFLSVIGAALLLAACETTSEGEGGTGGAGGAGGGAGAGGVGGSAAPTAGTQAHFVVNVGDRVFFGFDQFNLTPEARAVLDRQASYLAQYGTTQVLIEGHCDERGTREYNLALGERRSNSVREYLQTKGVGAARVTTISYGKERPAVVGTGESVWAQNRRAVTVIK